MMFDLHLTSIWPLFWPEMTQVWPCKSENGYLVTVECQIIQSHPRMLHFKVPRKHSWFWRSWRSNGGQNEVGSFRRWHIRKIWAKIGLCAKNIPNPLKTVAPPPPLKFWSRTPPLRDWNKIRYSKQFSFQYLASVSRDRYLSFQLTFFTRFMQDQRF